MRYNCAAAGKYRFQKNKLAQVRISNANAKGIVVANSVAFVKVEENKNVK
jgi:hypothetical protein